MAAGDDDTSIGFTLEKFNEQTMDFLQWLNTFEQLTTSLKIPDSETVRFLFDWLDPSVFPKILEKIYPYKSPFELPYDVIIDFLIEIFTDVKEEDLADYRFLTRVQLPYESVHEYEKSLKKLLNKCLPKYNSASYYKDIFIKGLYDQDIKEFLKNSKDLPFRMIADIAKHMEKKKKVEIRK